MKIMHIVWLATLLAATCCWASDEVTLIDFTRPGHGWKGNARTRNARQEKGFTVDLTGQEDPWIEGPSIAIPGAGAAQKLDLTVDAECGQSGDVQLFYAPDGQSFSADRSEWLRKTDAASTTYRGVIPIVSERMRFRLDPPGSEGRVTVCALRAVPLVPLAAPAIGKPVSVSLPENAVRVAGGLVEIAHDPARWNAFVCRVGGKKMAESNPSEALAYLDGKKVVTVDLVSAAVTTESIPHGMAVNARVLDAGGAVWQIGRRFTAEKGAVRIETALTVDAPRDIIHLPWLTLFEGVATFGERKHQALLPGVEYLENEPSSNEKEIRGVAANRRLVDAYKVCYPLMALTVDGQWFSLTWRSGALPVSPLFDSPDRVFHSGGHVMGLWSPAVGDARFESELIVYRGVRLEPGQTYACSVTVSGGKGDAATEAVADYVAREGLPPLPVYDGGFDGAVRLLASGWLDSQSRQGLRWRHAVWGKNFPPVQAEDVPVYLLWLAANTPDAALKARLHETAHDAITNLPTGSFGAHGISHVSRPTGALVYGNLEGLARQAGPHALRLANGMRDGRTHYKPQKGKPDYAETLGGDFCNGLAAMSAESMLTQASLSGDETAIAAALSVLDAMTVLYAGQVPRGAQPWEMPLHTPDIVASGRLVHSYVLGYLLSGRMTYLEQARYWAWTGATMVYLAQPTRGPIGIYATIGVIGATNWTSPNWIGQPVQWCGLVYRSALEDLARIDDAQREIWQTLAHGMTIAGLQMCFPIGDAEGRGGLLPDYFLLRQQESAGPAINPGTLQAHLAEAYGKTPMYNVVRLSNGSLVHVPGAAAVSGDMGVAITAWPEGTYRVLITRLGQAPKRVTWDGRPVEFQYLEDAHVALVSLTGAGRLVVEP